MTTPQNPVPSAAPQGAKSKPAIRTYIGGAVWDRLWNTSGDANDSGRGSTIVSAAETKGNNRTIFVTQDFDNAVKACRERVKRIAVDCRTNNRRFRDESFDLREGRTTIHSLVPSTYDEETEELTHPLIPCGGAARVTSVFLEPKVFIDGATPSDLRQGAIGDCYFISALAALTATPGLIERLFVEYDQEVGVYGFILFMSCGRWHPVIIDDFLFVKYRSWEELSEGEQRENRNDRKFYNDFRRTGSSALYFASSSDPNETWVPLLEKAYAKAHGDYEAIDGGFTGEAVEDLTGGVSTRIYTEDILDPDKFWTDELLLMKKDRSFAASTTGDNSGLSGLYPMHAYSVIGAKEVTDSEGKPKRFLRFRNPKMGEQGEWKGKWSDGAKEWNAEWLQKLEHTFADDGEFYMEYKDALNVWRCFDRTRTFNGNTVMASDTLKVKTRPFPAAAQFGDVSFAITLEKDSDAIINLSQADSRYFKGFMDSINWGLHFRCYRRGEDRNYIARSPNGRCGLRSVNAEVHLPAGEYVVQVRLERQRNYVTISSDSLGEDWSQGAPEESLDFRKLVQTARRALRAESWASNFDPNNSSFAPRNFITSPSENYAGRDVSQIHQSLLAAAEAAREGKTLEKGKETSPAPAEVVPSPHLEPRVDLAALDNKMEERENEGGESEENNDGSVASSEHNQEKGKPRYRALPSEPMTHYRQEVILSLRVYTTDENALSKATSARFDIGQCSGQKSLETAVLGLVLILCLKVRA